MRRARGPHRNAPGGFFFAPRRDQRGPLPQSKIKSLVQARSIGTYANASGLICCRIMGALPW